MTSTPTGPDRQPLQELRASVVNWRDLGHHLAGGSERFAWEYALALRDAGATVDFVTARGEGQSAAERRDGIRIRRRGGAFTFYFWAAWYLVRHRRHLDVVIDPECGIPVFSPLFLRRSTAVVLVVHHVHQRQFEEYFPAPLAWFGKFLEARVMPRVYRRRPTVAVSESTRDEMRRHFGWVGPIGLLENGANLPVAVEDATTLERDPHRLVVMGRLVPHKRVDMVIELVTKIRADIPDVRLDVIGRGPEEGRLRELVEAKGAAEYVTVHGYLPEVTKAELLARAGLHICASDVEGWGQVVIEAAAAGVPTVARNVPGLRDSVVDGETGWLASPEGPEAHPYDVLDAALRDALVDLGQPGWAAALDAACRVRAAGFSWSRMHAKAVQLVEEELVRVRP